MKSIAVSALTTLVAIFSVHFANGFFLTNNGYEYAFTLLAATLALTFQGAGHYTIDNRLAEKTFKQEGAHSQSRLSGVTSVA